VAESFARIFFRNAINVGLPIIEAKIDCQEGDIIEIDLENGIVKVAKKQVQHKNYRFSFARYLLTAARRTPEKGELLIFPADYKSVGMTRTDPTSRIGGPIYFTTDYLIADLPSGYKIYKVKSEGEGLLRKLVSLELIAKEKENHNI